MLLIGFLQCYDHKMRLLACAAAVVAFTTTAHAQSLTDQAQCAAQAKTEYQEFLTGWKQKGGDLELDLSEYESHYNAKLQRCLMVLSLAVFSRSTGKLTQTITLDDAFDHRGYAAFSRVISDRALDVLVLCTLTPTYGDKLNCKTHAEFDAFVAKYMEQ